MLKAFCILLLSLISLEATCYLYFRSQMYTSQTLDEYSFDQTFLKTLTSYTPEKIKSIKASAWDAQLGHTNFPLTSITQKNLKDETYSISFDKNAARELSFNGTTALSSYGDSFTLCDEVNDEQTWQTHLSHMLHARAENFGVGAYGPDQALLRLKHLRKNGIDSAPIVIFTIWAENINRLNVMYYGFYMLGTVGFKPMYSIDKGDVTLRENPLAQFNTQEDLLNAYQSAKIWDVWYRIRITPDTSFPYLWSAFSVAKHFYDKQQKIEAIATFRDQQSNAKMTKLLLDLHQLSLDFNFKPYVLFIPAHSDLKLYQQNKKIGYRDYIASLKSIPLLSELTFIDILDFDFIHENFNIKPFEGHASPYGNTIIANAISRSIHD
jgi:hypothetical protein